MARRGFIGRITRVFRNIVAPSPKGPSRPEPVEPRKPEPRSSEYRQVWRENRGSGSYSKNLRVFHSAIDPIEQDPDERLALWESYVTHINGGKGRFRRQDTANMFWRDSGLDPSDFNWQAWRSAMGYTGKRRSRTA